jgi:hypothetical protein
MGGHEWLSDCPITSADFRVLGEKPELSRYDDAEYGVKALSVRLCEGYENGNSRQRWPIAVDVGQCCLGLQKDVCSQVSCGLGAWGRWGRV